jgi:triosephosphate isomerase
MTPGVRPLIAGNWKMHGSRAEAVALARAVAEGAAGLRAELLVCPSFLHVAEVAAALAGSAVAVGGQDCHAAAKGAHTGDVAAPMLRDAGASHVILGHSERRADHGETDSAVRAKAEAAQAAGLVALICVGETEAERDAGRELDVIGAQLAGSVPDTANGADTVIAYEPVWAIGSGRTPTEEQIAAVHRFLRDALEARFGESGSSFRLLYGGSVKPANAAQIFAIPDVDGALVGGASLKATDFGAIISAFRG